MPHQHRLVICHRLPIARHFSGTGIFRQLSHIEANFRVMRHPCGLADGRKDFVAAELHRPEAYV